MSQRKALLVAIEDDDDSGKGRNSCMSDSEAFECFLRTRYGFAPEAIRVLRNEQVTPARVDAALAWLYKDATVDRRLVRRCSEHGYQVPSDESGTDSVIEEVLVLPEPTFCRDGTLSPHIQDAPAGVPT